MDAKKVSVILEAINRGSLKSAAEENGYTPSGMCHLLRSIEEELGVKLALRTNRGIEWSEAGKQLKPFLEEYVSSYRKLRQEAGKATYV